jgi:hypothetical protein
MSFILYCSTGVQIAIILTVFSTVSVLGLYIVRVLVPLERLKQNHEVAGFTFGVLGAFYGLLLAFVIVAAWERFDRADEKVRSEALAATSLYRLAKGFTPPLNQELEQAVRAYVRHIIDVEWPEMAASINGRPEDMVGVLGLWAIVTNYHATDPHQEMLVDKSFDQLEQMSNDRSFRYMYQRENFPSVVWLVIYTGLLITIGFSYFFGLEKFKSQALMCAIFADLLGLTILAIVELAHPYQGTVVVSKAPFEFALARMHEMDKVALGKRDGNLDRAFVTERLAIKSPPNARLEALK